MAQRSWKSCRPRAGSPSAARRSLLRRRTSASRSSRVVPRVTPQCLRTRVGQFGISKCREPPELVERHVAGRQLAPIDRGQVGASPTTTRLKSSSRAGERQAWSLRG